MSYCISCYTTEHVPYENKNIRFKKISIAMKMSKSQSPWKKMRKVTTMNHPKSRHVYSSYRVIIKKMINTSTIFIIWIFFTEPPKIVQVISSIWLWEINGFLVQIASDFWINAIKHFFFLFCVAKLHMHWRQCLGHWYIADERRSINLLWPDVTYNRRSISVILHSVLAEDRHKESVNSLLHCLTALIVCIRTIISWYSLLKNLSTTSLIKDTVYMGCSIQLQQTCAHFLL